MNNLLLLGSNGFLGSALKEKFAREGFNVIPVSNYLSFDDIEKWGDYFKSCLQKSKPTLVINAGACQSAKDDLLDIIKLTQSNVICPSIIAKTILDLNPNVILITIATSWQYGSNKEYLPFNLYAASKKALEDYLVHYSLNGLKCASLTLFDTYSEYDPRPKIHNLIKNSLVSNEPLEMTGGEQAVNYVHIEDCAEAIHIAYTNLLNHDYGELVKWAIKSKRSIKVKNLLNFIDPIKHILFKIGERPYRKREVFYISNEFETVPGWTPKKNLENSFTDLFKSQ
jgi:nucleoside-diphosphate-sugar epimerase